jgi:coiled-coil domain-containing protein 55
MAPPFKKRKIFGDSDDEDNVPPPVFNSTSVKAKGKHLPQNNFTNLSALHTSKKHTNDAETADPNIYAYDDVYDSLHAPAKKASIESKTEPKYMTNLLNSAKTRDRDRLRAKEKLLQKEREAEGDEFADKEKFVTDAYKKQQEEIRKIEEEEAKREMEDEEKRRKGGGMTGFYKKMLKEDERRHEEAVKGVELNVTNSEGDLEEVKEKTAAEMAKELNEKGAKVILNDEGQVVDKRQLLSAGLNVAPKPKTPAANASSTASRPQQGEYRASPAAVSARQSQRERQTRMIASQIESMEKAQQEEEERQRKEMEQKTKSKKTEGDISSAKERYLARKRAQEAEKARRKSENL